MTIMIKDFIFALNLKTSMEIFKSIITQKYDEQIQ